MAENAFNEKNYHEAKTQALRALKKKSDNPDANTFFVLSLLETGEYTAALNHLDSLKRINKGLSSELFYRCGLFLFQKKNIPYATRAFLEVDPQYFKAYPSDLYLGIIYYREGDYIAAESYLKTGTQTKPDEEGLNLYGKLLMLQGKTIEAVRCFKKVVEMNPDNKEAIFELGNMYFLIGKDEQAILSYDLIPFNSPLYFKARFNSAAAYERSGNFNQAIRIYRTLLKKQPDNNNIIFSLATALLKTDEEDNIRQAADLFTLLTEKTPKAWDVWFNLGLTELKLNKNTEAEAAIKNAININPKQPESYFNLGILLYTQGNIEEAGNQWEKTLQLDPDHARAVLYLKEIE